jgi:dihydrolipoamide dehydrogenase
LTAAFKKKGIKIETTAVVHSIKKENEMAYIELGDGRVLEANSVLVSVGRKLNTDQIGLENTGVIVEKDGHIETNEKMQTNVPHIYAIGDITGKWILAHVASHQGIVAADVIAGNAVKMHYHAVPSVIFTHPEIGSVGLSLEKAIDQGYDVAIGKFPFLALGKSQAAIEIDGFAQIVIDKKTGQILGAQVIGHEAATLIAEMTVAIQNELTVDSISETIHAHPTIAEAWMEAAYFAIGMPLHLPPKRMAKS